MLARGDAGVEGVEDGLILLVHGNGIKGENNSRQYSALGRRVP
jgi:hypothetical protein